MDAPLSSCHHVVTKRATYHARDSERHQKAGQSRSKSVDSPNARFACHFLIANPRKIQANAICARTTWPSIPRLKCVSLPLDLQSTLSDEDREHLIRRHGQQRPSCARCARTFEKQKDLEEHQRAERPCQILNPGDRPSQSISPAQMYSLRRRKGQYNESEVDKWFEIWDLLFPDKQRPRTPCEFQPQNLPFVYHAARQKVRDGQSTNMGDAHFLGRCARLHPRDWKQIISD